MIKIVSNSWLANFPVRSGSNQSFGLTTASEFYTSLKNVKMGKVETDAEVWINATSFAKGIPVEFFNETEFIRLLSDYNKNAADFLSKNEKFYLVFMSES